MRIALITDGISPYVIGGMQKHSFYLAKYFAQHQIFVDLVHYNDSTLDIVKLECFNEEERKFIRSIVLEFPKTAKFPGHYIYASYLYSKYAYNALKPTLHTYDFIYSKGFTGWKLIQEKRRKNINCCKIGVNFHGYEMFQIAPDLKSKLQQYMLKPFVKQLTLQADIAFSYGGKITGIIRSLGVSESKIAEIPSGIQPEIISTSISNHTTTTIKFVFLGRYERRKGILELHEVLKKLVNEGLSFKFEFIGPIPEMNQIKDSNILYHGEIRDFKKIKSILEQSDILVCPSWSEGFPNVILEGMASGLAIIATDVGAVSAMVSSKNGWLIEPGNKEELENIIKVAAKSQNTLNAKKQYSLDLLNSTFNWNNIFEKLIKSIK